MSPIGAPAAPFSRGGSTHVFSTTGSSFGMPARRITAMAATATATALALGATPAHATDSAGGGAAGAAVLRTGLDLSLLGGTAHLPVNASVDDVRAPASADRTALAVTLDGVENGKPVSVLRADTATARATADGRTAKGYANLVHARVHVPGLPLLSLIEVQQVISEAVCEAGRKPEATSNLLGSVSVLGKKVTLTTAGPTKVDVPGVGAVRLDLSKTATTSRTAAATALALDVAVDPLGLGVAKVRGRVTLAEATCGTPAGPGNPAKGQGASGTDGKATDAKGAPDKATDVKAQTAARTAARPTGGGLAETGGGSATPYLAAAAGLLVVGGAGALVAARRRRSARDEG